MTSWAWHPWLDMKSDISLYQKSSETSEAYQTHYQHWPATSEPRKRIIRPGWLILISLQSDGSTWRGKINDDCYRKKKELVFELRPLAYIHLILKSRHLFLVRRHLLPVPAYDSSTKYEQGQLWLISFFRQLLTTKVTTAQWICGSITPTEEWPRSLSAEETLNLNTLHSPTKMRVFWRTCWCKKQSLF